MSGLNRSESQNKYSSFVRLENTSQQNRKVSSLSFDKLPSQSNKSVSECLRELLLGQLAVLENLLDEKNPPMPEKLPANHLASHVRDVQGHSPIKQNYRTYYPKVLEFLRNSVKNWKRKV